MIRADYTVRMLQAIAFVLGLAILMWTTGFPGNLGTARAGAITSASDTITDSAPSQPANHTIDFITPNGMVSGETLVLSFESGIDLSALAGANDVDVAFNGAATTTAGTAAAGTFGLTLATPTAQDITLTSPTDGVASSTRLTILIGTNAASGDNQIVNPSATSSYSVTVGGTMQDSGEMRIAIIDVVTVSASVNTRSDFTVAGVASGSTVNSSPTTTVANSDVNDLPFGVLSPYTSVTLAHDLSVVTNASNGFNVTVEQSGDLQSSTGSNINGFIDCSYTNTPTAWTSPAATIGVDTTYGHWGLTSDDPDFSGTADRWVAASTTPRTIFSNTTVADGTQTGTGTTRIGYQVQISSLQEAGTDYSTELTYIATPTF